MAASIALAQSVQLTPHEALSGVFGSISLASWIFLLVPQLIENYRQGSAEGISLAFLIVWFIGDITNLAGAIWAGLVPTVIALAIYFCFADLVLISQCLYYNLVNARREKRRKRSAALSDASEEEPLLSRRNSEARSIGLPGSHRRRSSAASRRRRESSLPSLGGEEENGTSEWVKNALSIVGVCVVGAAGWAIAWRSGVWKPTPTDSADGPTEMALGAQILGYASAVCYLGARIPQIIKNYREKSCEGLSLLFFMLSLLGNLTYGAGIIFHSVEREYFLTTLPWLIGSLGTMVEDATIFVQFRLYGEPDPPSVAVL
ncbi:hypothetical protein H2201_005423 [Coniosporium apollinis]|uniref:Vacuolar membrane PQ loop repeat protein n=1 Tax=Coniosporium apollinis TaxID=61459 RepID=A0ABQ9NTC1_9PEZI|nr:hypothetical protein H2201_005423 [Coniosporium apollinis]